MTHSRSLSHGRPRSTIHSTRHSGTSSPYLPHQRFRFLSGISNSPRSRSIFPTIATCLSYRDRSRIACSPPVLPSVSSMSLSPGRPRVVVRAGAVSGSLRRPLQPSPIDRGRRCRHRFFCPVRLRGRSTASFARSCATLRRGGPPAPEASPASPASPAASPASRSRAEPPPCRVLSPQPPGLRRTVARRRAPYNIAGHIAGPIRFGNRRARRVRMHTLPPHRRRVRVPVFGPACRDRPMREVPILANRGVSGP